MLVSAAQIVLEELSNLLEQLRVTLEITDAARAQSLPRNQEALIIALRNLVENAALHGPEHGVVTVDAEQEGFAIKDRGGGIAPEDAAKMLEPFVRGPATNLPGRGLGIAIAAPALAPQTVPASEHPGKPSWR